MMAALLVMVHGSPRPAANEVVFAVAELIRRRQLFDIVEVCFMELNEPSIPAAIAHCVELGATHVIGVPYFLHAGNHVTTDLAQILDEAQTKYPRIEFLLGDYLGHQLHIDDVIRTRIAEAVPFAPEQMRR
jgi:sirohydrochlorin ferrochelatase